MSRGTHQGDREIALKSHAFLLGSDPQVTKFAVAGTIYDVENAQALRKVLRQQGFTELDEIEEQARDEARVTEARRVLRRIFAKRKLPLSAAQESRIDGCLDLETLHRWHENAVDAQSASAALD